MTTVLLIRHGRSTANTAGLLTGRTPGVALDPTGQRQVADLGVRLAPVLLVALVTSPLQRCRQTAQGVQSGREVAVPLSVDQGLIECGYGDWTGRSLKELSKEKLWATVQQHPSAVRFPNGEAMTEMSARAVGAINAWDRKIEAAYGPDAVWAAVSHGDVIKAILADALGIHLDSFQRIMVNPASVSVVRYTPSRPYVVTMNSAGADVAALIPPPAPVRKGRRRAAADHDAAVGGGLGAGQQSDPPADSPTRSPAVQTPRRPSGRR